jgi:hypothetical protein
MLRLDEGKQNFAMEKENENTEQRVLQKSSLKK